MTQVYIVLIIITIALIIRNIMIYRATREEQLASLKYNLFEVRDRLILLLAEEKLSKDDFLFKEFYPMTNYCISYIKNIKLDLKAIIKLSKEQIDRIEEDEFMDMLIYQMDNAPEEVREVIILFFETFKQIIIHNSYLIRYMIKIIKTERTIVQYIPKDFIKQIFPDRYEGLEQLNEIDNIESRLNIAV